MLKAELTVASGKQVGKTLPLTRTFLVGREQDCQLRPNSEEVSRHHCVITVDDYTVRVRDLGSTNGTYLNGERIRGEVGVESGDRLKIGQLELDVVIYEDESSAQGSDIEGEAFSFLTEGLGSESSASDDAAGDTVYLMPVAQDPIAQEPTAPEPTAHEPIAQEAETSSESSAEEDTGVVPNAAAPPPEAVSPPLPQTASPPQPPAQAPPQQPAEPVPAYGQQPPQAAPQQYAPPQQYGAPEQGAPPQGYPQHGGQPGQAPPPRRAMAPIPIRLPDPDTTGVKDEVVAEKGTKGPSEKENTAGTAAEIIRQFMNQGKPGSPDPKQPKSKS